MLNYVCVLLGKDSRRSFEKYLEGKKEIEKMEGLDESDQNLISMVMLKWKKIKATYLRRQKGNLEMLRHLLILMIGKLKKKAEKSYEEVKRDCLKGFQED